MMHEEQFISFTHFFSHRVYSSSDAVQFHTFFFSSNLLLFHIVFSWSTAYSWTQQFHCPVIDVTTLPSRAR